MKDKIDTAILSWKLFSYISPTDNFIPNWELPTVTVLCSMENITSNLSVLSTFHQPTQMASQHQTDLDIKIIMEENIRTVAFREGIYNKKRLNFKPFTMAMAWKLGGIRPFVFIRFKL